MNKKIVIIYGNCHTIAFSKYLTLCEEFNSKYTIFPIKPIQDVKDPTYFEMKEIKTCDVFIHQSIRENNRYGKEYSSANIIAKLKPTCQIIAIPNVYHLPPCFYPQYTEEKEFSYNGRTYFFRDRIIDEAVKNGKHINEIVNTYHNYVFDEKSIIEEYHNFIDKVKKREREWDIKVSDFILKNTRKIQLFYDPNHPTNALIKYYAQEVLKKLLEDSFSVSELMDFRLDSYEMPTHESVHKALNLDYKSDEKEMRITGMKIYEQKVYLKQYISQYFAMLWTCREFDKFITLKSRIYFEKYRILQFCKKAINKIVILIKRRG